MTRLFFPTRYQFNPNFFQSSIVSQILLKALTNLPHNDFVLCKSLLEQEKVSSVKSLCQYTSLQPLMDRCKNFSLYISKSTTVRRSFFAVFSAVADSSGQGYCYWLLCGVTGCRTCWRHCEVFPEVSGCMWLYTVAARLAVLRADLTELIAYVSVVRLWCVLSFCIISEPCRMCCWQQVMNYMSRPTVLYADVTGCSACMCCAVCWRHWLYCVYVLCCVLLSRQLCEEPLASVVQLHELLETCQFPLFWVSLPARGAANCVSPLKSVQMILEIYGVSLKLTTFHLFVHYMVFWPPKEYSFLFRVHWLRKKNFTEV